MFCDNLAALRKLNHLSQEELAELFHVSLDDFVNYDEESHMGLNIPPRGKHMFGIVSVGAKEQIVIPAKARKIFEIKEGG